MKQNKKTNIGKKYDKPISLYPLKLPDVLKAIMKMGDEKIKTKLKIK